MVRVPSQAVGRVMTTHEAMALLYLSKKPPASGMTRRSH
jgi:hypothetical protein